MSSILLVDELTGGVCGAEATHPGVTRGLLQIVTGGSHERTASAAEFVPLEPAEHAFWCAPFAVATHTFIF